MKIDIVLVAGICGCGKTTLAKSIAERLSWRFIEADEYHSETSREKMASGVALNDDDRLPWLQRLNRLCLQSSPCVISCSALKQKYRDILFKGMHAKTIWLNISRDEAEKRVSSRIGHFMPASLVESQLLIAEPPENQRQHALVVEAESSLEALTDNSLLFIQQL